MEPCGDSPLGLDAGGETGSPEPDAGEQISCLNIFI